MRKLFMAAVLAAFSVGANASLLFDNGTNTSASATGWCSTCPGENWQVFDDFTVDNGSFIEQVVFEGKLSNPVDITVSLWSNLNSGLIYSESFTFSELTPVQNSIGGSLQNYTLTANLPSLSVTSGTYWLSFSGSDFGVAATTSPVNGGLTQVYNGSTNVTRDGDASFRVYGSVVPIPAAVWLFGSALAGLGWMRRKQTV